MPKIHNAFKPIYTTKKRYILVTGGRGSAKTFTVQDASARFSYERNNQQLYTRYTLSSAQKTIIPEYKETLDRLKISNQFRHTESKVTNLLTNNYILFSGIKPSSTHQRANLKSLPNISTWIQEEGEDFVENDRFDKIDDSIRTKNCQNRIIWIQNPTVIHHFIYDNFYKNYLEYRSIDGFKIQICKHPNVEHIHTTYLDNLNNLSDSFIEKAYALRDRAKQGDLKAQNKYVNNYLGGWVEVIEGALWDIETINNTRKSSHPQLVRIGIGVDPATTNKKNSDDTGIVIAGLGVDGHAYVLKNLSGKLSPDGWGRRVVSSYQTLKCDFVVAEVNQGGDMVKTIIQNIDRSIVPKQIHATKGKFARAEPIEALYEDGRVHHVGHFPTLEMQMTTWTPNDDKSPDDMDALVYVLTELMITPSYGTFAG